MQKDIVLIDTSVLMELLKVPGFYKGETFIVVKNQFEEYVSNSNKYELIMPITTLIESGNHIAGISNHEKKKYVDKFSGILADIYNNIAPWKYYRHAINEQMFLNISNEYSTYALRKIGMGDLCILKIYEEIENTIPMNGQLIIWSLDDDLQGYNKYVSTL